MAQYLLAAASAGACMERTVKDKILALEREICRVESQLRELGVCTFVGAHAQETKELDENKFSECVLEPVASVHGWTVNKQNPRNIENNLLPQTVTEKLTSILKVTDEDIQGWTLTNGQNILYVLLLYRGDQVDVAVIDSKEKSTVTHDQLKTVFLWDIKTRPTNKGECIVQQNDLLKNIMDAEHLETPGTSRRPNTPPPL